jgi:hypothetical protein
VTRGRWVAFLAGYGIMVFGAIGLLRVVPLRTAGRIALWVVAADVVHDFVLAPLVCVAGLAIARAVPTVWRWPVRMGAVGTAFVLLVGYPALRGFGRATAPGNPSVLPLDYPTAIVTAVAVVWGLAALWGAVNWIAQRTGLVDRPRSS